MDGQCAVAAFTPWSASMKARIVAIGLTGALLLAACSSNDRRQASARQAATRAAAADARGRTGTSDPGSRYLDTAGPVGGIAVETAPIPDGAPVAYYPELQGPASESRAWGPSQRPPAPASQMQRAVPSAGPPGVPPAVPPGVPSGTPSPGESGTAQPGVLPAPALPPREQVPLPPTGGWR